MLRMIKELWRDESGATAIEYALIAGLMAAALIVAISAFSDQLKDLFDALTNKLEDATDTIGQSGGTGQGG